MNSRNEFIKSLASQFFNKKGNKNKLQQINDNWSILLVLI